MVAALTALAAIEPLDSDGDGSTNLAEITALFFPGDPGRSSRRAHGYQHPHSHANEHTNQHTHQHTDQHTNPHLHRDPHEYSHSAAHQYTNSASYQHLNQCSDGYIHLTGTNNSHTGRFPNIHHTCPGYSNRDSDKPTLMTPTATLPTQVTPTRTPRPTSTATCRKEDKGKENQGKISMMTAVIRMTIRTRSTTKITRNEDRAAMGKSMVSIWLYPRWIAAFQHTACFDPGLTIH